MLLDFVFIIDLFRCFLFYFVYFRGFYISQKCQKSKKYKKLVTTRILKPELQAKTLTLELLPLSLYIEMQDLIYPIALKECKFDFELSNLECAKKVLPDNIVEENYT